MEGIDSHYFVGIFPGNVRTKCDSNWHRNRCDRRTFNRCNDSGGRNIGGHGNGL